VLPTLEEPHPFDPHAIEAFRRDGHVRIDRLAGFTLHRAPPNRSKRMREVMTLIYFVDGTRVGPLDHPNRRFARDAWLPGCEPGGLAASPRNPLLWQDDPARDG
jgi:hypothetical protein